MMETNLIQKFSKLFDEVEKNDRVEIVSSQTNFPTPSESLRNDINQLFTERYGYRIPDSLIELVSFPAKLCLDWRVKGSQDPELFGEFCLENIINAITLDKNQVKVTDEDIDEGTKILMRKARYFDTQPQKGWDTATVLILEEGRTFPDLWLLDDLQLFKMRMSMEEYFDALFLTKGMYYWQYLFCDESVYRDTSLYKKEYIMKMLEILPVIFPERDYSALTDHFNNLNS
jgi:hypothetical protein